MESENKTLSQIEHIIGKIMVFKGDNALDTPEFKDYIIQITDPRFKLFENIGKYIYDPDLPNEFKKNLFFLVIMCLDYYNECGDILKETDIFVRSCINYFSTCKKEDISKDGLLAMCLIYDCDKFLPYITEEFFVGVFNLITELDEEMHCRAIISVILDINANLPPGKSNFFKKVFEYHDNSRVVEELILQFMNEESDSKRAIGFIYAIISIATIGDKCLFYTTDLITLVDILQNYLLIFTDDLVHFFVFECFEKLFSFEEYYTEKYKITEITEIMKQALNAEDENPNIKEKAKNILDIFSRHVKAN